ncbi:TetR/AcrR family transcriptional regulator [Amycolatopsis pithecellobii]|uniref:TetR family transcriptional regulator n=1 Tax=Amycolatopsis pithecellobii TaxID=664692 RepID=A0A6N7Z3E1_9PSEU|nr:TetR/AcrR family transcriptional regulator [Amycolatopsis pithecellobii]MTD54544.1 TetR family transcriptional regulator [Amycolatopsis pithecellobii]
MSRSTTRERGRGSAAERPLRRDAERNRERVLDAAHEVFAARGLEATLNDIAHHAGLGVGTVYRRFPNKDCLVEIMFVAKLDRIRGLAEEALAEPATWSALVRFMEEMAGMLARDRGLYQVSVSATHGHDRVAAAREEMCRHVGKLIERGEAEGLLRPGVSGSDVQAFTVMLGALVDFSQPVRPELWRRYLAVFLDGLRRCPGQDKPLPEPALTGEELAATL